MTKDDFLEWKSHPVTKQVMKLVELKIAQGKEELSMVAGQDPGTDRQRVGKLEGLRDVHELSFYDLEEVE